jgi:redox-sensitive bicupin YhaK (pirin superfamily)
MMDPRYREVKRGEIPEVSTEGGAKVKIVCGRANGVQGPVRDIVTDPEYLDVAVPKGGRFTHPVKRGHTVFAYVIEGSAFFDKERERLCGPETLVHYDEGDAVSIAAEKEPVRFLLVSGKPIGEPVAWYGPIVMNTDEEIRTAFDEYRNGTFIKHR